MTKQIFKVNHKYPHLSNGKFVNDNIFSLLLKLNCSIIFGDVDIIIILIMTIIKNRRSIY